MNRLSHMGAGVVLACVGACGTAKHPPPALDPGTDDTSVPATPKADACASGQPTEDPASQGLCGSQFLPALGEPPNLYFLIDCSGSMGLLTEGREKYAAVAGAAVGLVRELGARIKVGAAVFPGSDVDGGTGCAVGGEVFGTQQGDSPWSVSCGDGPVTRAFSYAIRLPAGVPPLGGTPTAATLAALLPTLTALSGRTYLILATDGGPNCGSNASCDASQCIANIEQALGCDPSTNCCAPGAAAGPENCLDGEDTLSAIERLRANGILTYVIGVPGSVPYQDLLDQMATSGGTARSAEPRYYDVENMSELDQVLASIGASVVLTCHFVLEQPPPAPSLVNVYLDRELQTYGDAWTWTNPGDAGANGFRARHRGRGVRSGRRGFGCRLGGFRRRPAHPTFHPVRSAGGRLRQADERPGHGRAGDVRMPHAGHQVTDRAVRDRNRILFSAAYATRLRARPWVRLRQRRSLAQAARRVGRKLCGRGGVGQDAPG